MKKILSFLLSLTLLVTLSTAVSAQKPNTKVTMGIHLDYFFSGDDGGIRAKGVTEGRPAQKAGIIDKDIVLAINDTKIKGLFHYRDMLGTFNKGEKVKLKVNRGGKIIYLDLTFD